MKYIIMCGCKPDNPSPKHLVVKDGEELVARTIRLLRQEGVEDIAISTNNSIFEKFGLEILKHKNDYYDGSYWVDGFYPTEEPVCYVFGDVFFSEEAINKIVTTETEDVMFFASAPPFPPSYPKEWAEPFAFKVVNQTHFREAIEEVKALCDRGRFTRHPIAWELWQVIAHTPINFIHLNYAVINDYTCDVDEEDQVNQWRDKK